jgi:hypothetical protein
MKLSASDENGIRTDLGTASNITILAINTTNPTDTFTGTADVLDPLDDDTYNHEYAFVTGDTAAAGTFHVYTTVTEADATTITTYGPITLSILTKT